MTEEKPERGYPIIYCNQAQITTSLYDFSIMLGLTEPPLTREDQERAKAGEVMVGAQARLIMSPPHFKKFLEIAVQMLSKYEELHGTIAEEKPPKKTR